ncbi:hypothetical protein KXX33_007907 [Aspergillus fumigatus]|nr:hypothetical protein KXX33_007907 [Aspergillus fumigatus]KAH1415920.1 hypothetical protein KXX64_005299 [Aspergillus fumigatus]KAH1456939.1 hypothetical protein KXX53_006012 [Aspergillus fumigatus]KAH1588047.1 hypothetical protein KXX34_006362 [Aspergillus fumigatus]KAH1968660.1 hypothetical protein KXX04_009019 [Aspergillus fumigatus]
MHDITLDPLLLGNLTGKTAVLTGGAGGIGTAIAKLLLEHGANVVVADLEHTRPIVETMIVDLPELVIANAEVMERTPVLDMDQIDEHGNLEESHEFCKVIDINVKGTMNCLRHAIFSMKGNQPCYPDGSRGAVVLVSSISGYFGGTGVSGYITSKHAVTGMLRGSQLVASQYDIRVNAVAPFVTPTAMAGGFSEAWQAKGLPINTTEGVATVVLTLAVNPAEKGSCYIVSGPILREVEHTQKLLLTEWLGEDLTRVFRDANEFFESQGGVSIAKVSLHQWPGGPPSLTRSTTLEQMFYRQPGSERPSKELIESTARAIASNAITLMTKACLSGLPHEVFPRLFIAGIIQYRQTQQNDPMVAKNIMLGTD